jgi:ferrochelatase
VARTGVLLTAFGGPADLEAVPAFLRSIMGIEPSEAVVQGAIRKYVAIGGSSPLPAIAERVAAQLERALNGLPRVEESGMGPHGGVRASCDVDVPVAVGMLHASPSIGDAVAALVERGVTDLAWVSLSPFDAAVTVGAYESAVVAAAAAHPGVRGLKTPAYRGDAAYVRFFTDGLNAALRAAAVDDDRTLVVFSAHSLPQPDVDADPAYVDQLRETVAAVARGAGLGDAAGFDAITGMEAFGGAGATPWLLAFQSKGARGGEWLGPDLADVIDAAAVAGFSTAIVCPVGFALDHMETLYDIDTVAAGRAQAAGLRFTRTAVPNDDPLMIEALAASVRAVL